MGVTADVLGNDNKLPYAPYDLERMYSSRREYTPCGEDE
jgi:hypothetical protein